MQSLHYRFWPRYLPHTMRFPATSLVFDLEVSAARYPEKPLLIYYGTPLAFAHVLAEVEALAGWLQQRCGVRRGDRVLLFMQNSPQFLIGYYAIARGRGGRAGESDEPDGRAAPLRGRQRGWHHSHRPGALS